MESMYTMAEDQYSKEWRSEEAQKEYEEKSSFRHVNQQHQLQPLDIGSRYEQRVASFDSRSQDLKELDARVKSMMTKSQNMIQIGNRRKTAEICKVCGKEGNPQAIKDHIEAKHLEGVSLPCNNCGKTFRSRIAVRRHKLLHYT